MKFFSLSLLLLLHIKNSFLTQLVVPIAKTTFGLISTSYVFHYGPKNLDIHSKPIEVFFSLSVQESYLDSSLLENYTLFFTYKAMSELRLNGLTIKGQKGTVTLSFVNGNFIFNNYPFFLAFPEDNRYFRKSVVGLSRNSTLLQYLYEKYKIGKFLYNHKQRKLVFVNELHVDKYRQNLYSKTVKLTKPGPFKEWEFTLDYVVGNLKEEYSSGKREIYVAESYFFQKPCQAKLSSEFDGILAPPEFISFILQNILTPSAGCSYTEFYSYKYFMCDEDVFNPNSFKVKSFSFIFGDKEIKFDFSELFFKYHELYLFYITENSVRDLWTMGLVFLSKYQIMFDDQNDEISFLSESQLYDVTILNKRVFSPGVRPTVFLILMFSFILLVPGTVYLIFLKYKFN